MVGLAAAMYPHAIQRVYAAESERTLRRSLAGIAWMPLVTTSVVFVIGRRDHPHLEMSETASEQLVGRMANDVAALNPLMYFLMVLFFGGVVAAIVSTADSALLSFASMVSRDVYAPLFGKDSDEGRQVMVGKVVSVIAIAVLLVIAWNPPGTLYSIFVLKLELLVQIAPAFIIGLYWRRLSALPALVGVVAGAALAGALAMAAYESPTGVPNGLIGLAVNLVICIGGSLLHAGPGRTRPAAPTAYEGRGGMTTAPATEAYDRLLSLLLAGTWAPQTPLREESLASMLGTSRTPVRDALRRLEGDGLVQITPRRGARVVGYSAEEIDSIYDLRAVLEGLAARWAAERGDVDLDAMTELAEQMELRPPTASVTRSASSTSPSTAWSTTRPATRCSPAPSST